MNSETHGQKKTRRYILRASALGMLGGSVVKALPPQDAPVPQLPVPSKKPILGVPTAATTGVLFPGINNSYIFLIPMNDMAGTEYTVTDSMNKTGTVTYPTYPTTQGTSPSVPNPSPGPITAPAGAAKVLLATFMAKPALPLTIAFKPPTVGGTQVIPPVLGSPPC